MLTIAEKRKWIDNLRSGLYTQGRINLRDYADQYCCLGVAVDLFYKESWIKRQSDYAIQYPGYKEESPLGDVREANLVACQLNPKISMKLGTDSMGRYYIGPEVKKLLDLEFPNTMQGCIGEDYVDLSRCNDSGMSFNQIARIIEVSLPTQ